MKRTIITAALIALSITLMAQKKQACFKHTDTDEKNQIVFEQSVFFAQDFENQPRYYLRTKLVRKDELIYIKDDDITNNDDKRLPGIRKREAYANLKKMLTINAVINHL